MRKDVQKLTERFMDFAVDTIRLVNGLSNTMASRHIGGQSLRSGTSAAANYEEGRAAESRADFLHKLQVTLGDLRESRFWLCLLARVERSPGSGCLALLKEADELCNIIAKSILTTREGAYVCGLD